jgi:cellobiose-specific phosphotransferase system component IIA
MADEMSPTETSLICATDRFRAADKAFDTASEQFFAARMALEEATRAHVEFLRSSASERPSMFKGILT